MTKREMERDEMHPIMQSDYKERKPDDPKEQPASVKCSETVNRESGKTVAATRSAGCAGIESGDSSDTSPVNEGTSSKKKKAAQNYKKRKDKKEHIKKNEKNEIRKYQKTEKCVWNNEVENKKGVARKDKEKE